jgi:DNA gyrase subunit A
LVVSDKGYGKRSDIDEYRVTNRGGKGVKTINITDKTGNLVAIKSVTDANDLMIITKNGITIRMNISDLRVMGRATQGVRLINIQDSDSIAAVTRWIMRMNKKKCCRSRKWTGKRWRRGEQRNKYYTNGQ